MFTKKFIGWSGLALLVIAILILTILVQLVIVPPLAIIEPRIPQAMIVVSGVVALVAAILGFYTDKTSPGKVSAIGGLVLFIAIACLHSFTTIALIRGIDA